MLSAIILNDFMLSAFRQNCTCFCLIMLSWMLLYWVTSFWMVICCVSSFWVLLCWVQFRQNCTCFCLIMLSWMLPYWVASFWVLLCWVQIGRTLLFLCYYAECHYAECCYVGSDFTEWRHVDVIKCYAEWRCTWCLYAECHGTYSFLTT
jgi:hypothetical protein